MKKVLFINGCVRPNSRTYILAQQVLKKLGGEIEEVNLEQCKINTLDWDTLQKRDSYIESQDFSNPLFKYAKQFADADEIVIAAPYWDLSFPSTMRIYLEAITVLGLTFTYTPEGCPTGLCKAKKLIYLTTAGGPIAEYNLGYDYIKALSKAFYGIPEVICYKAENLDIEGANVEEILEDTIEDIENSILQ